MILHFYSAVPKNKSNLLHSNEVTRRTEGWALSPHESLEFEKSRRVKGILIKSFNIIDLLTIWLNLKSKKYVILVVSTVGWIGYEFLEQRDLFLCIEL